MEQVRVKRSTRKDAEESAAPEHVSNDHKSGEELKDEMDALLDEIDEVLEENASEFVKSYIQKGGQ